MTRGGHFRHPGGGGSRAKPGISPTWASATCPEREHAPKIATPEVVAGRPLPIAKLQAMMLAHTRAPLAPPRAATQRTHAPKRVSLQASESHSVACPIITTRYKRSLCRGSQEIERQRAKGTLQAPTIR